MVISTFPNDVFACKIGAFGIRITSIFSVVIFQARSIASICMVFIQGVSEIVVLKFQLFSNVTPVPLIFNVPKLTSKIFPVNVKLSLAIYAQEFTESKLITGFIVSRIMLPVTIRLFSKSSSKRRLTFFSPSPEISSTSREAQAR
ncbi:MAG: hypothetical protein LBQ59_02265 [Candidatus Peribacteria bacterium]|nr:hypothetical protein [Candidatus Peribacteria bacterium]